MCVGGVRYGNLNSGKKVGDIDWGGGFGSPGLRAIFETKGTKKGLGKIT